MTRTQPGNLPLSGILRRSRALEVAGLLDGGAADEAGLTAGDTSIKLGSATISTTDDLTAALARLQPGDQVMVTWTDVDGQTGSATVTLASSSIN